MKKTIKKKDIKKGAKKQTPIKRVKLKSIKTANPVQSSIDNILIFPNKNYLLVAEGMYRIYNSKNLIVKTRMIDYHISKIKIIDDNNFICIKNYRELININIKNGKTKCLIDFRESIHNILFYKNKFITLCEKEEEEGIIKIWEKLKNGNVQCITTFLSNKKFKWYPKIFLTQNNNILVLNGIKEPYHFNIFGI